MTLPRWVWSMTIQSTRRAVRFSVNDSTVFHIVYRYLVLVDGAIYLEFARSLLTDRHNDNSFGIPHFGFG